MCASISCGRPVMISVSAHFAPSSGTMCARVRFHLPLGFKHFRSSRRRRYFVRQWGARGVLASILDGNLVVHL